MTRTLLLAQKSGKLEVSVCVTGMHLAPVFGSTVKEVEATGLRICGKVPVALDGTTGVAMARALGHELIGIADVLARENPDIVVVLGDRGEMLSGALAAIHLNIPIVHIHGGERSGTIDEPVRHAISKLAHYHLVTTEGARERLVRMGEVPEHVYVTGAPGLDGLQDLPVRFRQDLCREWRFDPDRPVALVVFHAVLQEESTAGSQMESIMQAVLSERMQAICLMPNADAGGSMIRKALQLHAKHPDVRQVEHLARTDYLSWMQVADIMVGNSSSGIIEAASFRLPVINVGSRQSGRERSGNVIDVAPEAEDISTALRKALRSPRGPWRNIYGDGHAGERIVTLLASLPLSPGLMYKSNAY